jgi:hypothetical protein
MSIKKCTCCKIEKELNEFWFNKKQNIYHPNCKTCKYEKSKKYINVSKEQKSIYDATYREKHKEQLKISKKEEYERNKSKYIKRVLKNQRTLEGRLKHNIRTRISSAISRRSNSSKTLLGCEIVFYISYLEYLFDYSMSWDNYGTYWHIDHINPICNFNLTIDEQRLLAFNWKNTRPLKADENLSRSNKSNFNEIQTHNNLIEKFLNATSSNCGDLLRA